jgi:GntR family transcriptional regulator
MDTDGTLAEKFATDLRQRIEDGQYGTSGLIESTPELVARWNTQSRAAISDALQLLRAQGFIRKTGNRYRVVYPRVILPGLTANFREYLESLGHVVQEDNLIEPRIEVMSREIASLFTRGGDPVIAEGVHVIHRLRRQGTDAIALRLGEIWYPATVAGNLIDEMKSNASLDVLARVKEQTGLYAVTADEKILARIPTIEETTLLNVARLQPVLEVRRIVFDQHKSVLTLHRTTMDGTRFEISKIDQNVPYWK